MRAKKATVPAPPTREQIAEQLGPTLPDDAKAIMEAIGPMLDDYDTAVMTCDPERGAAAAARVSAAIYKLNDGTFFDSAGVSDRVTEHYRRPAGEVPRWGEAGEFLVVLDGMRTVVRYKPSFTCWPKHFEFYALDVVRPFISETGYRSHFLSSAVGGLDVYDHAREVLRVLARERKRMPERDHRAEFPWVGEPSPSICVAADAGGQLAMMF